MSAVLDLGCLFLSYNGSDCFSLLLIILFSNSFLTISRFKIQGRKTWLILYPASNLKASQQCIAVQVWIIGRKTIFTTLLFNTFHFFSNVVIDFSKHHRGPQARANSCSKVELLSFRAFQSWPLVSLAFLNYLLWDIYDDYWFKYTGHGKLQSESNGRIEKTKLSVRY